MCGSTLGSGIATGATVVLRRKFSVRNFVPDCVKYKCDVFQYIGELCRYLCNSPVNPDEEKMHLKCAFGNGLRPDIWEKFKSRFHVERIVEFYGATEGTLALYNSTGKVGALGYIPPFLDNIHPARLVVVSDECKEIPIRDEAGRCVRCKPGQVGLLISPIPKSAVLKWDGYSDKAASEKKLLSNVFSEGDQYFNSGDLLYKDEEGFYYWSDRVGDTFRWRGENVSTAEVEQKIMGLSVIQNAVVYGVEMVKCDGKAGMASIVLNPNSDILKALDDLTKMCYADIPAYARPYFIRIMPNVATTGTFKIQKNELTKQGYNPKLVGGDDLFFCSWKNGETFTAVTAEFYSRFMAGDIVF